jgi:hypothetical protein
VFGPGHLFIDFFVQIVIEDAGRGYYQGYPG